MSARALAWLGDSANFFVALLASGLIIAAIMGLMWLAGHHEPVLHNHLWSYNFQLSPADECGPRQWDCALSDEIENMWICVPRSDDARLHRGEVGESLGSGARLHLTEH